MRKPIILFAVKNALIVASVGMFLRIIFFQNWLAIINTFVILYLAWTLFLIIVLIVLQRYFREIYDIFITSPGKQPEETREEELGRILGAESGKTQKDFTQNISGQKSGDDIDRDEIYGEATTQRKAPDRPGFFKPKFPIKPPPNKISSKELEEIKRLDSKDIAKAVKLMIGPDEDNPLIDKDKDKT